MEGSDLLLHEKGTVNHESLTRGSHINNSQRLSSVYHLGKQRGARQRANVAFALSGDSLSSEMSIYETLQGSVRVRRRERGTAAWKNSRKGQERRVN